MGNDFSSEAWSTEGNFDILEMASLRGGGGGGGGYEQLPVI